MIILRHVHNTVCWTLYFLLNAGPPNRRDFTDDVITITFEAGGPIVLTGNVPIRDDEIDEANEVFITRLSHSSDQGTISIGNDRIVCEIIDNDGEKSTRSIANKAYL